MERSRLLTRLITGSALEAMEQGRSLTLIRPRNTRFIAKRKSAAALAEVKEAYTIAARQTSIFDQELAELEPSPFDFRFQFEDDAGRHDYQNGDWETHVMFWRRRAIYGEAETLNRMASVFNDDYPVKGMVFALGTKQSDRGRGSFLGSSV
jgi:hypothetical protein